MGRFRSLREVLLCAEELHAFVPAGLLARGMPVPHWTQRESLSKSVAELLVNTQFAELVAAAFRLHDLLNNRTLIPELVLPAVRNKVRSAALMGPTIREFAWSDVTALISGLNTLREFEMFHPFVETVARPVGRHVVEAIKLTIMTSPAVCLSNRSILDSWPTALAAFQEAGNDIRSVIYLRLLEAAKRFSTAKASASSSPATSSLNQLVPLTEVMMVASHCGFLDHSAAVVVCDALVPGFVRDGVKTVGTLSWMHKDSGPVVARQLATQLKKQPECVCYNLEGRMFFFDHNSPPFGLADTIA